MLYGGDIQTHRRGEKRAGCRGTHDASGTSSSRTGSCPSPPPPPPPSSPPSCPWPPPRGRRRRQRRGRQQRGHHRLREWEAPRVRARGERSQRWAEMLGGAQVCWRRSERGKDSPAAEAPRRVAPHGQCNCTVHLQHSHVQTRARVPSTSVWLGVELTVEVPSTPPCELPPIQAEASERGVCTRVCSRLPPAAAAVEPTPARGLWRPPARGGLPGLQP